MNKNENPPPPKGFLKTLAAMLASKLGMGLLCTVLVSTVTNSPAILRGFRFCCSIIGMAGNPEVTKKVTTLFDQGEKAVRDVAPQIAPAVAPLAATPPSTAVSPETIPPPETKPNTFVGRLKDKADKAAEPAKKSISGAVDQGKESIKKAEVKADEAIGEAKEVVGALKNQQPTAQSNRPPYVMPSSPPTAVGVVDKNLDKVGNVYGQQVAAKKAAIDQQKARLEPLRETYAIWWSENGLNGSCINPRCRAPMKVSHAGNGAAMCPRCGLRAKAGQFRTIPPPMPPEPPPQFYAWKKHRDDAEQKKQSEAEKKDDKPAEKKP